MNDELTKLKVVWIFDQKKALICIGDSVTNQNCVELTEERVRQLAAHFNQMKDWFAYPAGNDPEIEGMSSNVEH